jgi:hypothetical protein
MGERGMNYNNPIVRHYQWGGLNIATPAPARRIKIPPGVRFARIVDFYVNVTTAATVVTTAGKVQLGDGSTANKYMDQKIGVDAGTSVAAGTVYGIQDVDGRVAAYNPDLTPSSTNKGRIDLKQDGATAGTLQTFLDVTTVAPTGGTPAGVADYNLVLEFF